MRGFFQRFNNTVQHFMYGRYGIDELSSVMLTTGMVCALLSLIRPLFWLGIPAFVIIILAYFRCFSKRIDKRRHELDSYYRIKGKIKNKYAFQVRKHKERKTFRYFKCKMCKKTLRVPKGKGKIEITCPRCKNKMIKRT